MSKYGSGLVIATLLATVIFVSVADGGKLLSEPSDPIDSVKTIRSTSSSSEKSGSSDLRSTDWQSLKRSKYLTYLFRKYGSGGMITFEGLEHMMHNLGLGGLEFSPNHAIEEHHPEGYRVYEEEEAQDGNNNNRDKQANNRQIKDDFPHFEPSTTSERPKHIVEIKIEEEEGDGHSEEIVLVKESQHRKDLRDKDEITVEVKSNEGDNEDGTRQQQTFISMHDPKHRHPKDHHLSGQMSCLSPSSMIKLLLQHRPGYLYSVEQQKQQHRDRRHVNNYQLDDDDLEAMDVNHLTITPKDFVDVLCPALLTQIEREECVTKKLLRPENGIRSERQLFQFAWLYATIAIVIISMCGLVGVAIVPIMRSTSYNYILMFLVAVAIGTLAGDALMHLLPHALTPHLDHGDDTLPSDPHKNDEAVYLCAFAFLAALVMYVLETMLPLLLGREGGHGHSHHHHHHHHHQHNAHEQPHGRDRRSSSIIQEEMSLEPGKALKNGDADVDLNLSGMQSDMDMKANVSAPLSPIAFMVVIGDGLHNITDGLAIGAAFAFDPITGMATALAVLCHELPHELGDFALLLKTGVSIKRALVLNVISSVLSLIGMAIGLIVAGIQTSMVRWIYSATAGTFLYIAFADLIPELTREPEGKTLKSVLCQVSGILMGGLIMLTIALNEDRLRILFE